MSESRIAASIWLAGGAMVACAAAALWFLGGRDHLAVVDAARPAASHAAPCESDAQCVGGRHAAAAAAACKAGIEDLASNGVRWSDPAVPGPRFSRSRWLDQPRGTLTFAGDQAAFETASGAWQPVSYECDFDPAPGKLLQARVNQGRLP